MNNNKFGLIYVTCYFKEEITDIKTDSGLSKGGEDNVPKGKELETQLNDPGTCEPLVSCYVLESVLSSIERD
jgi:hypothetical protein